VNVTVFPLVSTVPEFDDAVSQGGTLEGGIAYVIVPTFVLSR